MNNIREDFEKWFIGHYTKTSGWSEKPAILKRNIKYAAWLGWQASRKAIVITAPPFVTSRAAIEIGYTVDYSNGHGDAMDAYELVLKEAGITIKGEE